MILLAVLMGGVFSGCSRKGCTDHHADNYDEKAKKDDGSCLYSPDPGTVEIQFDHEVSGATVNFDEEKYINGSGNKYSVTKLKYFVSNIKLHKEDGSEEEVAAFHFRDARDAETRELHHHSISPGKYTGLSFVFGLDEDLNKSGALPNETVYNNFAWPDPMGGGYHYMQFEGKFNNDSCSEYNAFAFHTGKLNSTHNYFTVYLDNIDLDIDDNAYEIMLMMDLNKWMAGPNSIDLCDGWQSVMGDQAKQDILKENGKDIFMVHHVMELDEHDH